MQYTEVEYTVSPLAGNSEILIAFLSEIGFSMFQETDHGVKAYIETSVFDEGLLRDISIPGNGHELTLGYKISNMPDINWNEEWEKNFEPVKIGTDVYVRAEYHEPDPSFQIELVIHPRMAFGTGHHATTSLMMEAMLKLNLKEKTVLDMGCGTGILAILAAKLGADGVTAVDIDPNSTENTLVNAERNGVNLLNVVTGGAAFAGSEKYDVILANINRNIILEDLPLYLNNLTTGGVILTSGYYEEDLEIIKLRMAEFGLKLNDFTTKENWCRASFKF